jgi:hypothetical protein
MISEYINAVVVGSFAGLTLKERAAGMAIGFGTATGYLLRIFQKTPTHHQRELAVLINSLIPALPTRLQSSVADDGFDLYQDVIRSGNGWRYRALWAANSPYGCSMVGLV